MTDESTSPSRKQKVSVSCSMSLRVVPASDLRTSDVPRRLTQSATFLYNGSEHSQNVSAPNHDDTKHKGKGNAARVVASRVSLLWIFIGVDLRICSGTGPAFENTSQFPRHLHLQGIETYQTGRFKLFRSPVRDPGGGWGEAEATTRCIPSISKNLEYPGPCKTRRVY